MSTYQSTYQISTRKLGQPRRGRLIPFCVYPTSRFSSRHKGLDLALCKMSDLRLTNEYSPRSIKTGVIFSAT